jgi:FKBP-type peptidyl-prolyl cis-trans isomerase SlyD
MQIARDTVVSITYQLLDRQGAVLEQSDAPVSYLHGGYEGMFVPVELALEGKGVGDRCRVDLEPDDAFGEYEAALVRVEPLEVFPANVAVGMRFEGTGEDSGETRLYTVTEIADGKVVVDGNHPLAGRALVFSCVVTGVRAASREEIAHGHVHGTHGHHGH